MDDILEEDIIQNQEASIWELSYNSSTLIQDIVNHLQDYYNRKNINKDIDLLYREATSILDLINKFKKTTDVTDKTVLKHSGEFQPHLLNIINNEYLPSYISPIVYDQKKFYTKEESYLDGTDLSELKLKKDVVFVDETVELQILNEINKNYRDKKNSVFNNHKDVLTKLNDGGQIAIPGKEQVSFEPINRSHVNNQPSENEPITFFNTELKNNTRVVRNCFSSGGCTVNPDDTDSGKIETAVTISTRLADGEIIVIKDYYDDRFLYETKGEIKSCNSAGDKFYNGVDKTTDLHKTISKPPKHCKYVDGESINIVGFFIKAISTYKPNIINGNQIVKNEGSHKIYPSLYNNGITINNACQNNKQHGIKIIENHEDFSWIKYNPNLNYVILFKNNDRLIQLDEDEYHDIVSQIVPTIDDIMELEKDNIDDCLNMEDLYIIMNKHNIQPQQLSTQIMKKYKLTSIFINNSKKIHDYEKYLKNTTIISKDRHKQFMKLDNKLLQFKSTIESGLSTAGLIPDTQEYIEILKSSFKEMSNPILEQYTDEFISSFIKKYLEITTLDNDRAQLLEIIIIHFITSSDSLFIQSEFTKCFTNPEEVIDGDFQELFTEYLTEYNIPINPFTNSHINHFDKNILKHLDFISNMKTNKDNSHEIIDIINLSNLKNLQQNMTETMDSYGKKIYNSSKTPTDTEWSELNQSDKNIHIPDMAMASELKIKATRIREIYDEEKTKMSIYLKKCKNIRIMKEYVSLEELILDNNKTIYTSPKYDSTKSDLALAKTIEPTSDSYGESFMSEFNKQMKTNYIFETDDTIAVKISGIMDILHGIDTIERRKILSGDYAIINDGKHKLLYLRRGISWIPIDKSVGNIQTCFKYDKNLLEIDFDEIKTFCLDYKDNKETACVHTDENTLIVNKLYKLYTHYKSLVDKKTNIVKVLEYKRDIKSKINKSFINLTNRLKQLKNMNKRKIKVELIHKVDDVSDKVYPPKQILDRLNYIKRIEDFDQRNLQLADFIGQYGVDFKTIDGRDYSNKFWWYNIDKVNVPLICKHNTLLMASALYSSEVKEANMQIVRDKFGIMDGEFYYCKNCGEVIDYQKYSEFEGFGKDDKVINIREVMVDEDDDYSEDLTDLANIPKENTLRSYVNIILRKINIDIRVSDYKLIIDIINNRVDKLSPELNNMKVFCNDFYMAKNKFEEAKLAKFKKGQVEFEKTYPEYNLESLRNFADENKNKENNTFIKEFWNKGKKGKIPKLQFGYKSIIYLSLAISVVTEVIRTAIPDYNVKGSGQEKSQKSGVILNDMFESIDKETNKLWILTYITNTIFSDISSGTKLSNKFMAPVKDLLTFETKNRDEQPMIDIYNEYVGNKHDEITHLEPIIVRQDAKVQHRLKSFIKQSPIITYNWEEFLPSLGFNNEYTFEPPNIIRIIELQKAKISELKTLNLNYKTASLENRDRLKEALRLLTNEIQDQNQYLKNIEDKLGFQLITNVNNIIVKEPLPTNFNPSAYINSSNYDNIKKNYIDDYTAKDTTIRTIRTNLSNIKEYFSKFAYDINIIYDILKTTFAPRDLQHFMKLDKKLYNNDPVIIKTALINKIKQSHFIYNMSEGDNYGDLRHFKIITDKDYQLVTDIIIESDIDIVNQDSDELKQLLRDKLKSKYGEDYPNIEFKVKLLLTFNGTAEVDIVSLEFKTDISDNIDRLTSGKSEDEINNIISEIEMSTNKDVIDSGVYSKDHIKEFSNKELLEKRVVGMFNNYIDDCDLDSSVTDTIKELTQIQTDINSSKLNKITDDTYKAFKDRIETKIKPYICKTTDSTIDDILRNFGETASILDDVSILKNIINMDDYYNELIESIESQLKIEDITDVDIKGYESNFRINDYTTSKFSNRVNVLVSIIRYIISILSNFSYRLDNTAANNDIKSDIFLQADDRMSIKNISEDSAKNIHKIIGVAIGSISDKKPYIMPIDQFKKINTFLDKLTMYNNTLTNTGDIDTLFVNTPEVLVGTVNHIILYLLSLLRDEDDYDDSRNSIMSSIFSNIMNYIKDISFVNNITDKTIKTVMDKHRANENQARLKRFNAKDDEDKGLHNIYRKFNLGKQIVEEEMTIDQSQVGFLTSGEDDGPEIILNDDGSDNMDAEQEAQNQPDVFNIDNVYAEDQEDQEENE